MPAEKAVLEATLAGVYAAKARSAKRKAATYHGTSRVAKGLALASGTAAVAAGASKAYRTLREKIKNKEGKA